MTLSSNHVEKLAAVVALVDQASQCIMAIYRNCQSATANYKDDGSPCTEADLAANAVLCGGLMKMWPGIPVLSEEGKFSFRRDERPPLYWAVDPLDGTREFIARNGEFTVNVALVEEGQPVLGVVAAPALNQLYAASRGIGAFCRTGRHGHLLPLRRVARPAGLMRIAVSRSHPSAELANLVRYLGRVELIPMGSSLKLCMAAQGEADAYPRLGPTCIWDIAAGHAILDCAGGAVLTLDGKPVHYECPGDCINPPFVAWSGSRRPFCMGEL